MFRFQFDYTLEDMNALSRVTARAYRWKKVLLLRLVLALLGAAYLVVGGAMLTPGSKLLGLILLGAGVLFLCLALFYHQGAAWRTKRMMGGGAGSSTVTLEDEGVHGKSELGESSYPYSAVIGAYHYRERYFLFLDKRHAILLPERALIQGEPAGLKDFLEEKMGKEITQLSGR